MITLVQVFWNSVQVSKPSNSVSFAQIQNGVQFRKSKTFLVPSTNPKQIFYGNKYKKWFREGNGNAGIHLVVCLFVMAFLIENFIPFYQECLL